MFVLFVIIALAVIVPVAKTSTHLIDQVTSTIPSPPPLPYILVVKYFAAFCFVLVISL